MIEGAKYKDVASVEMTLTRWNVSIRLADKNGEVHEFVASADWYFTEGDGIWFGTLEEFNKEMGL